MKKILLLIAIAIMAIGNIYADTWILYSNEGNWTMKELGTNQNGDVIYSVYPGKTYTKAYYTRNGAKYCTRGLSSLTEWEIGIYTEVRPDGNSPSFGVKYSGRFKNSTANSYTFLRMPSTGTIGETNSPKFSTESDNYLAGTSLTMTNISASNIIYNSEKGAYECELTWNSTKSKDVIEKYEIIRYLNGATEGETVYTRSFNVESGFVTNGVETDTYKDTTIPKDAKSISYKVVATPVNKLDVLFNGGNMNATTSTYTFPTTEIKITDVETMRGTGVADGTYMATVNWTSSNPSNVESYSIYRKISFLWDTTKSMSLEKAENEYNLIATVDDPNATKYTDVFTSSKLVQDLLGIKVAYKVAANYADTEGIPAESESEIESTINNDVATAVENINIAEVKVYPNPASSVINISGVEVEKVEIYDIQSRLVATGQTSTVDISSLAAGVYFVKVNGLAPQRIIVK